MHGKHGNDFSKQGTFCHPLTLGMQVPKLQLTLNVAKAAGRQ